MLHDARTLQGVTKRVEINVAMRSRQVWRARERTLRALWRAPLVRLLEDERVGSVVLPSEEVEVRNAIEWTDTVRGTYRGILSLQCAYCVVERSILEDMFILRFRW